MGDLFSKARYLINNFKVVILAKYTEYEILQIYLPKVHRLF